VGGYKSLKYIDKAMQMTIDHGEHGPKNREDLREHIINCHCPADDIYQIESKFIAGCADHNCEDCWNREMEV
jgi:hypothetical protein